MFENHKNSLNQNCERSELRLHFQWTKVHYSTVESDLLNSLAWDIFYILSSTVGYKISTMGYKISTMEYKLYPTVELSTMGYKLLYPIVDKKYPTLSY